MNSSLLSKLFGEVLRIQRWAGGDVVSGGRMFALINGFESAVSAENEGGISSVLQKQVEGLIKEVERGEQSADGMDFKERLISEGIDDLDAAKVIEWCILEGHYANATKKLTAPDSHFRDLSPKDDATELQWLGAIHYVELVDCTEDAAKKLHGCFTPSIPRIGEGVTPENGSTMKVVDVEWVVTSIGEDEGRRQNVLVPHVYLTSETETDD